MESGQSYQRRVAGHFPKCGAIFMADNTTRTECFQRKIFGLPSNFANFVKKIKSGMLLFLFDYQNKKLYGVFKAISDGGLNIVPHAYWSSKKQFPAQVRFRVLWRCTPVPEEAFCDSIKENYFAPHKFNFGLSGDQVKRLLVLFKTRRIRTQISRKLSWKRRGQTGSDGSNSGAESNRYSDEKSESFSEICGSLPISDNENADALDGNESQPLIDAEEIENPLPDGLAGDDFIPLPAIDLEENKDPLPGLVESPFKMFARQQEYDALQSAIDSLFSEVGGCPLQEEQEPLGCDGQEEPEPQGCDRQEEPETQGCDVKEPEPQGCDGREEPEPQGCDGGEGDKQNIDGFRSRVNGLYSDSSKERTSVFLRLSGLSKVIKQEQTCRRDKIDGSSGSLGRVEDDQKSWNQVCSQYRDPKPSIKRKSVFSRLSYKVGPALEKDLTEKMPANNKMCFAIPEVLPERKCKNRITETLCEVEGSTEMQFETYKRIHTSKNSSETKISDHSSTKVSSTGLVLPSGTSASTVNCESHDAVCKCDWGSNQVASEESKLWHNLPR